MRPAPFVAKIECARMDGTERRTLTRDVQWPNSLFLDKKENILYWTEAYYDRIQGMFLSNGTILNGVSVCSFNRSFGHDLSHIYNIHSIAMKVL